MVLGRPEIFICSDTNPLFQRIVNLNLRPDDVVPFPTTHLETIHIESRPMAVRIRMENYMREQGYSDEEIQSVVNPVSQRQSRCCRHFEIPTHIEEYIQRRIQMRRENSEEYRRLVERDRQRLIREEYNWNQYDTI